MSTQSQPDAADPLVAALRRRVKTQDDRIDELEVTIETLTDRIDDLERVVSTDPRRKDWAAMTRHEKVRRLRDHLVEEAEATDGRAAMTYTEVKALFDGNPSPGHCYDLMEDAGRADGFDYGEAPDGHKRITVRTDATNPEPSIRATNKGDR